MQNNTNRPNKKHSYRTFEEYEERFRFSSQEEQLLNGDPYIIGTNLAKASLKEFGQILVTKR